MQKFHVSERLACRVLGQHRSTQRKVPRRRPDEEALTADIVALASEYGRYGYRWITALLRDAGWVVNVKRLGRIWLFGMAPPAVRGPCRTGAQGPPQAAEDGPTMAQ